MMAKRLRKEAKLLPPSDLREAKLRKARLCEIGSNRMEWLFSPGLQAPK